MGNKVGQSREARELYMNTYAGAHGINFSKLLQDAIAKQMQGEFLVSETKK